MIMFYFLYPINPSSSKKFFFGLLAISWAAPAAYRGSQARGPIGAVAAGHSHVGDPSHVCNLHHSSQQHQILNPLSEARNQTCILMDASQIHFQ